LEPIQIEKLKEEYIIQVACGSRHSVALARRGTVFVFGNGELGQMANGNLAEISPTPKPVSGMPSYPVVCVLAGEIGQSSRFIEMSDRWRSHDSYVEETIRESIGGL